MYFNDARRRNREVAAGDQRLNGPAINHGVDVDVQEILKHDVIRSYQRRQSEKSLPAESL